MQAVDLWPCAKDSGQMRGSAGIVASIKGQLTISARCCSDPQGIVGRTVYNF
jgi:hypothetical protein